MPLSDQLDEVIACAVKLDRVELHATANVPFGQVDPAPLKAELEAAKKALLEDCLSKSETVRYLRGFQAGLEKDLEPLRKLIDAEPKNHKAHAAMCYAEGAEHYVRRVADGIENGPPESSDPPQSS